MENKEMNKNAPVELDEETLNVVSGGAEPGPGAIFVSTLIIEEVEKRAQNPDAYYE